MSGFGDGFVSFWGWSPAIPAGASACGFACWVGLRVGVLVSGGVVGWFAWLLFVNCIVDASIFVAKFFRAHGGCLGIRSR